MSISGDPRDQFAAQVRALQIIVAAVALGPVAYLGVVVSTAPPRKPAAGIGEVSFTHLACGVAAVAVVAWLVVPLLAARKFRRQIAAGTWPPPGQTAGPHAAPLSDAAKLCALYTVRTIIAVAILEGATFFLVFAYQQQRDPLALGVAVVLMAMIAAHLPTRGRVAEWIKRQLERLENDRQMEQFHR